MIIKSPLCITSRLLSGVQIGEATISIEYAADTHVAPWNDGRQAYRWFIDLPGKEFTANDLASSVGGGSLQEGLENLLVFLGAFAEAIDFQERSKSYSAGVHCENADLFPAGLAEWAVAHRDEIGVLACDLSENPGAYIIEEGD